MDESTFWRLIAELDWEHEGDDDKVVEPVVNALAAMDEAEIASFHDTLAAKLHMLDGQDWDAIALEARDTSPSPLPRAARTRRRPYGGSP